MRLDDEITRTATGETEPAYVYYRTTAGSAIEHEDVGHIAFELTDRVIALVEPGSWSINESVTWRGEEFTISHVARRIRHGEEHHYTLTLQQV